jgi:hypothetical protein
MKWLCACLAVLFMVAPAMAGEDPYIAVVGNDCRARDVPFYFSPKHLQFFYDQDFIGVPLCFGSTNPAPSQYLRVGNTGCESFFAQTAMNQPEVCHYARNFDDEELTPTYFNGDQFITLPNVKTPAGNSGWYEWWIRLPKKPSGEINIVIQCGVVKPNAFAVYHYDSVKLCAAETGERIGYGTCVRQEVDPGVSPVINTALPKIKAIAYPGPFNDFVPFNLTAFKNPSSYTLAFDAVTAAMSNNTNSQVLDGSTNARILLKACMDKAVITKLPVTGQINALGQTEQDLEPGDIIQVRMEVPRQNTVDIYCHVYSTRLQGVGESVW